jgi:hypothetical protein
MIIESYDEGLRLIDKGFEVLPKNKNAKMCSLDWKSIHFDKKQFEKAVQAAPDKYDGLLIRLKTKLPDGRFTRMLDFDIYNPELAAKFRQIADEVLGNQYPIRVGRPPKFAIFVPCDEVGVYTSHSFSHEEHKYEKENGIELRTGNLLAGIAGPYIEAGTGTRYEYQFVRGSLDDILSLQSVSVDQLEELILRCREAATELGWTSNNTPVRRARRQQGEVKPPVPFFTIEHLKGGNGLMKVLSDNYPELLNEYLDWVKVGMCLHHQFNGHADALDVWDEWSKTSPKYVEGEPAKKWKDFGTDTTSITLASLLYKPAAKEWWRLQDVPIQLGLADEKDKTDRGVLINDRVLERVLVQRYVLDPKAGMFIDTAPFQFGLYHRRDIIDGEWPRPTVDAQGNPIRPPLKAASKIFLASNKKSSVFGVSYHPTSDTIIELDGEKCLNTFRPWGTDGIEGPVDDWLTLCRHIWGQYCDLVLDWMAFSVQKPATKIRWQILVFGAPRTGKTLAAQPWINMFEGSGNVITKDMLDTGWGDYFFKKKALSFEEVWAPGGKAFFNHLKPMLSNNHIENLNLKGKSVARQQNLYSIYMCSNHVDALSFNADEDKLLVIRAPKERLADEFYEKLGDQVNNPSSDLSRAIRHFLMNRNVSSFKYGHLPERTEAMYAMSRAAVSDSADRVLTWIDDEQGPFVRKAVHFDEINEYLESVGLHRMSKSYMTDTLTAAGWSPHRGRKGVGGKLLTTRFWAKEDLKNKSEAELYEYAERNMQNSKFHQ